MYFHTYYKAEWNRITFIFLPHVKLSGGVACSGLALGLNCADGDHASRVAKSCDVFFKCSNVSMNSTTDKLETNLNIIASDKIEFHLNIWIEWNLSNLQRTKSCWSRLHWWEFFIMNVIQCLTLPYNTMRCHSITCNTTQYHTIPGNTIQCYTIPHNTM